MHPLTPLDHLLALVLAIFFPIRSATFGYRRLARAAWPDVPRVRRALYNQALAIQWTLAASVVALWLANGRAWSALGLVWRASPGALAVLAGLAGIVIVVATQIRRALADPDTMARVRKRLANVTRMMPATDAELGRFYALSATAGICEELLYRGFLLDYLRHFAPLPIAAGLAVLLFGIGHSYQGVRGIVTTGIAGAVLMAIVLVSGSLYPAMLAHALMDAYSGTLARHAFAAAPGEAVTPAEVAPFTS